MVTYLSVDLSNRCAKACPFCYNGSAPGGEGRWPVAEVESFLQDCAAHGLQAVSFGGGEPLEYEGIFHLLGVLRGRLFRSLTSNGLPLADPACLAALLKAAPDKVHLSLHFPDHANERARIRVQVGLLLRHGIRAGVNILVARSALAAARVAVLELRAAGLSPAEILLLPRRGGDSAETPTVTEMGYVAGGPAPGERAPPGAPPPRFQAPSCLLQCGKSPRFCSVGWDRTVGWCSYTSSRVRLAAPTHAALATALDGLPLAYCGAPS
jgi:hypothetical protein